MPMKPEIKHPTGPGAGVGTPTGPKIPAALRVGSSIVPVHREAGGGRHTDTHIGFHTRTRHRGDPGHGTGVSVPGRITQSAPRVRLACPCPSPLPKMSRWGQRPPGAKPPLAGLLSTPACQQGEGHGEEEEGEPGGGGGPLRDCPTPPPTQSSPPTRDSTGRGRRLPPAHGEGQRCFAGVGNLHETPPHHPKDPPGWSWVVGGEMERPPPACPLVLLLPQPGPDPVSGWDC